MANVQAGDRKYRQLVQGYQSVKLDILSLGELKGGNSHKASFDNDEDSEGAGHISSEDEDANVLKKIIELGHTSKFLHQLPIPDSTEDRQQDNVQKLLTKAKESMTSLNNLNIQSNTKLGRYANQLDPAAQTTGVPEIIKEADLSHKERTRAIFESALQKIRTFNKKYAKKRRFRKRRKTKTKQQLIAKGIISSNSKGLHMPSRFTQSDEQSSIQMQTHNDPQFATTTTSALLAGSTVNSEFNQKVYYSHHSLENTQQFNTQNVKSVKNMQSALSAQSGKNAQILQTNQKLLDSDSDEETDSESQSESESESASGSDFDANVDMNANAKNEVSTSRKPRGRKISSKKKAKLALKNRCFTYATITPQKRIVEPIALFQTLPADEFAPSSSGHQLDPEFTFPTADDFVENKNDENMPGSREYRKSQLAQFPAKGLALPLGVTPHKTPSLSPENPEKVSRPGSKILSGFGILEQPKSTQHQRQRNFASTPQTKEDTKPAHFLTEIPLQVSARTSKIAIHPLQDPKAHLLPLTKSPHKEECTKEEKLLFPKLSKACKAETNPPLGFPTPMHTLHTNSKKNLRITLPQNMVSSGDVTKEGFHLTEYTELRHKTVKARHIKNKVNLIYGIPFKQYNNNLIHDKKNQSILIKEELKILLDKLLFLKNVLKNGIKRPIRTIFSCAQLEYQVFFNGKLEEICGLMAGIAEILLQEFAANPEKIGIKDIQDLLFEEVPVPDELKNYSVNSFVFSEILDHFRDSIDAYTILLKQAERPPFDVNEFFKLAQYMMRCRYYISNFIEEYRIHEYTYEDKLKLNRFKQIKNSQSTATFYQSKQQGKKRSNTPDQKPKGVDENTRDFIKKSLARIQPNTKSVFYLPKVKTKPERKKLEIEKQTNFRELKNAIRTGLLHCSDSLRVQLNGIHKEINAEIRKEKAKKKKRKDHLLF